MNITIDMATDAVPRKVKVELKKRREKLKEKKREVSAKNNKPTAL